MIKLLVSVLVAGGVTLSLAGCPMKKSETTPAPAGGGGGTAAAKPFGDTMADAVLYHTGSTIKGAVGCSSSGYAKFDFPVGQAVKMTVTAEGPAGTCLSVSYLKSTGGAVDGMMKELCVDKNASETWDVQGLEGGSFLQVLEQPPCKNAGITVTIQ